MVNEHYYRSGGQWRETNLAPVIDEIKSKTLWDQVTDHDSEVGSAPTVVARSKFLTDTGSTYENINLRDLWADLGDGIKHRIIAVHNDTKLEFENYIDSVPGTINLTFWMPRRITLKLEGGNYIDTIHFDDTPLCLTIVGDGGAYLSNGKGVEALPSEFALTTFNIIDSTNGGDAGNFQYGSITFDDIHICNRNRGTSIFDGSIVTKAYEDDVGGIVNGRLHVYCFDITLESIYKHTGLSIWHAGTQIEMSSKFISAEQTIEHISADRAITIDCICDSVKAIDGHYQCGVLAAVRWENSATDNYQGGMVVMGSYLGSVGCLNDTWKSASGMGGIGFLLASSELGTPTYDTVDPTITAVSIGNLHKVDIPDNQSYGQALRVTNYNTSGSNNMKIQSFGDSFITPGDVTNYHDAYGDRGAVELFYPYKTPVLGNANGGSASTVKT